MLRSCNLHDRARAAKCGLPAGVSQSFSSRRYAPPQQQSFVRKKVSPRSRMTIYGTYGDKTVGGTIYKQGTDTYSFLDAGYTVVTEAAWSWPPQHPNRFGKTSDRNVGKKSSRSTCEPVIPNMSTIYIIRHMQKHRHTHKCSCSYAHAQTISML